MPRHPIPRRALSAAVTAILLAGLMPLAGVAGAATPSTNCESSEGTTCWLDLSAPSSVRTGFAFAVQVRVTTDSSKTTVAKTDPCGSKAQIGLDVTGPAVSIEDPGPTTTYTATASAGIATFNLTIGTAGDYSLDAHSPPFSDFAAAAPTDCGSTSFVSDETSLMAVFIPADSPIGSMSPGHELRPGDEWQRHAGDHDRGARLRLGSEARRLLRAGRRGRVRLWGHRSTPTASSGTRSRQLR